VIGMSTSLWIGVVWGRRDDLDRDLVRDVRDFGRAGRLEPELAPAIAAS